MLAGHFLCPRNHAKHLMHNLSSVGLLACDVVIITILQVEKLRLRSFHPVHTLASAGAWTKARQMVSGPLLLASRLKSGERGGEGLGV
jgi:hypothetical protein